MSRRAKRWALIGFSAVVLIAVLVTGVIVAVQSVWFRQYVMTVIISATEKGTGGRVEIGSYTFDWRHLRSVATNFIIHGEEPPGYPPYLRADRVQLDLRLFGSTHHLIDVSYLAVDRPQANVFVFPDGHTNIPVPRTKSQSNQTVLETVLDLAVGRFELTRGQITFGSQKQALDITGNNLRVQLSYNPASQGYQGLLLFEPVYVVSGRNTPVTVTVSLPLSLRRDRIDFRNARISTPQSLIVLGGYLENLRDPVLSADVNGHLALADLKAVGDVPLATEETPARLEIYGSGTLSTHKVQVNALHVATGGSSLEASGPLKDPNGHSMLTFRGRLDLSELGRLADVTSRPGGVVFLQGTGTLDGSNDFHIDGSVQANNVSFYTGGHRTTGLNAIMTAKVDPHRIALNDFRMSAFGAEVSGKAAIQDFARYQLQATVKNLSLRSAAYAVGRGQFAYGGIVRGLFDAAGDLKAPGEQALIARARLSIAPGPQGVPVSGRLNIAYSGAADDVAVENSFILLPHTRLSLNGTLKDRLMVGLSSTDLSDVFASFPGANVPAKLNGGRFDVTAAVTGGIAAPQIAGHVTANRFQLRGRQFDRLDADMALSKSGTSVRDGVLTRETMQAQFSAALGLNDWKALPNLPVLADASIQNGDLRDIVAMAGVESGGYSGMLTASAHLTGTVGNPRGIVRFQAVSGTLQEQPFDRMQAQVNLSDQLIAIPNASLETSGGRLDLAVDFQHPRDRLTSGLFHARMKSTPIDLAKLTELQRRRPNTAGAVQLNADIAGNLSEQTPSGTGTAQFLLTKITADCSLRGLRSEGQSYGDLNAMARTNGPTVNYDVTSDFVGSNIKVSGSTQLTPGYPSKVDANLQGLPVERILAFVHRTDIPVKGRLSGTAHLTGTLDQPTGNADLDLTNAVLADESVDRMHLRLNYLQQRIDLTQLQIASGPSHIDLTAIYDHPAGTLQTGNLQIHVNSSRIDLSRIKNLQRIRPELGGILQISANGAVQVQATQPRVVLRELNADVKANGFTAHGKNLGDASLTARTSNGKVNFTLDSDLAMAAIHGRGSATLAGDHPVDLQATFSNLAWTRIQPFLQSAGSGNADFEAVADGQISVRGPLTKPDELAGSFQVTRLQLNSLANRSQPVSGVLLENQGPIAATLGGGVIRIQTAHVIGPQTDFQANGTVPLRGQGLDLTLSGNMNLALLHDFSRDIDSSGRLTLAARIRGATTRPLATGRIELHDGSLHYANVGNGLSNANGVIQFNGQSATFRNLTAESGGGKVTLAGFMGMRDGIRFGLRANASKVRVRLQQGVSIVADSDVRVTGTPQNSLVSGTVSIDRVSYAPQTDLAALLNRAPPLSEPGPSSFMDDMKLDIRVRSSRTAAIQASVAENLGLDVDLQVRGTGSQPGVLGRVSCSEGQLVLFGATYTLDSGTIGFFNPTRIEPVLDLNLETQAKGVTVSLRVNGPIDNLKLSYTSDPPLQLQEIVGLLAAGTTPTSDPTLLANQPAQPPQSFQQMGESAILGKALADPVASRLQRVFGVSQLKIDPAFTSGSDLPQAQLTLQQRVTSNVMFTYVTGVSDANAQTIRVEWTFNTQWSATATRDQNGIVSVNLLYKRQLR